MTLVEGDRSFRSEGSGAGPDGALTRDQKMTNATNGVRRGFMNIHGAIHMFLKEIEESVRDAPGTPQEVYDGLGVDDAAEAAIVGPILRDIINRPLSRHSTWTEDATWNGL